MKADMTSPVEALREECKLRAARLQDKAVCYGMSHGEEAEIYSDAVSQAIDELHDSIDRLASLARAALGHPVSAVAQPPGAAPGPLGAPASPSGSAGSAPSPSVSALRAPILGAERYRVAKASGSQWARVIDNETGLQVARFNVLKGSGKRNGWDRARALCVGMNKESGK